MAIMYRAASLEDVPVLAQTTQQGFETYKSFAPAGWAPPPADLDEARIADRLARADAWCLMAEERRLPVGHVALLADETLPDHAYLWMLFVRRPWWGMGVGRELHARVVAEAVARGYVGMRLVTPAGQARARAFYEREGWVVAGEPVWEPLLALDLVEYGRSLG